MKFSCDKCGAQYQISDDKLGPKGAKVRCKKCGHMILLRRPVEVDAESVTLGSKPIDPTDRTSVDDSSAVPQPAPRYTSSLLSGDLKAFGQEFGKSSPTATEAGVREADSEEVFASDLGVGHGSKLEQQDELQSQTYGDAHSAPMMNSPTDIDSEAPVGDATEHWGAPPEWSDSNESSDDLPGQIYRSNQSLRTLISQHPMTLISMLKHHVR